MTLKNKRKIINKWIENNGACSIDLKTKNIILHGGGLFSIDKKKIMVSKSIRHKQFPDGGSEVIFSKAKKPSYIYQAHVWFNELDETINYLKRMKKMLNSIGYKTNHSHCTV